MPSATLCVPCQLRAGDVAIPKRFDETVGDGERVETFFTNESTILYQLRRNSFRAADDEVLRTLLSDDDWVEMSAALVGSHGLSKEIAAEMKDLQHA